MSAWESLFRAQVSVMRRLTAEFPRSISLNEYDVLFNLSRLENRSCRLRDLTEQTLLTQPSISRMIDRLVARGLVEKTPDPSDGRGTIVRLTDDGAEAYRAVAIEHARSIDTHLSSALSREELAELERLTTKLRRAL
ncbi:MAG: MarR family transcriptional regulator [Naasia sp.]